MMLMSARRCQKGLDHRNEARRIVGVQPMPGILERHKTCTRELRSDDRSMLRLYVVRSRTGDEQCRTHIASIRWRIPACYLGKRSNDFAQTDAPRWRRPK